MSIPELGGYRLRCRFAGIVALFADDGASRFAAGIIKPKDSDQDIKGHVRRIAITEYQDGRLTEIIRFNHHRLRLEIDGGDETEIRGPGIRLFRPSREDAFDRDSTLASFDWVLDIENELYRGVQTQVGFNPEAIGQVLEVVGITRGIFFTDGVTEVPVLTQRRPFQRTALGVDARIELPPEGAVLKKLNHRSGRYERVYTLRSAEAGYSYELVVENICDETQCASSTIDEHVTRAYNDLITVTDIREPYLFISPPVIGPADGLSTASNATSGCPILKLIGYRFS